MKHKFCCRAVTTVILSLLAGGHAAPAFSETRALLVGVWDFESPLIRNLKGPENDLNAMETLARNEGATDVTVLRNDQVTRTTFETALHALGLRAKPGDWILLYYSGHGALAEAAVKGTRDGDLDEFIPLAKFDPDHQDTERFILDKDFYDWLDRYIPTTTQILMIADTCHSGTLNRSVDPRAFQFTPRMAFRGDPSEIQLIPRPAPRFPSVLSAAAPEYAEVRAGASVDRADLTNLIYIAASKDDQLAQEAPLPVSGAPSRGLLTYSLEQGLTTAGADGKSLAADLDQDGKVTVAEIGVYLNSQVRALTGQRQESVTSYTTGKESLTLFAALPAPPKPTADASLPAVFATDPLANAAWTQAETPWRPASERAAADFVWDNGAGEVVRRSGDVVAQGVKSPGALRGVIEKWGAVEALRPLLDEARLKFSIGPKQNGTRYRQGERVVLGARLATVSAATPVYLTVFNLASDGTVQRLYPLAEDGEGKISDAADLPEIANTVIAPYGVDHVVALATPQNPTTFRALLRSVENQRAAGRLVAPIKSLLISAGAGGGLSVGELYTGN